MSTWYAKDGNFLPIMPGADTTVSVPSAHVYSTSTVLGR